MRYFAEGGRVDGRPHSGAFLGAGSVECETSMILPCEHHLHGDTQRGTKGVARSNRVHILLSAGSFDHRRSR